MPLTKKMPCALCTVEQDVELHDGGNVANFRCPSCGRYFASLGAIAEFKRSPALRVDAIKFVRDHDSEARRAEFTFVIGQKGNPNRIERAIVADTKYRS